ncbi:MAG: hypothetical protein A2046_04535 [Bacteroidetes bacterium GWA2_30_7]|nr:MAG: hypothetical protein A2046_04535 [Bacteroidetes bacterium GWA2_30_7]
MILKLKKILPNIKFISFLFIFIFAITTLINANLNKNLTSKTDSLKTDTVKKDTLSKKTVNLRSPQEMFLSCARCHSIGKGKLVGPDLFDVISRHDSAWFANFIRSSDSMVKAGDTSALRLYLAYEKLPMPNHDFSPEEIQVLLNYIELEGKKLKANPNFLDNTVNYAPRSNSWLFILSILLILLPLFDLIFSNFLKYKIINVLLILVGLAICGKVLGEEAKYLGRSLGYEPDQPIKFSHRVHAGENKINCIYCHTGAIDSRYASIPATTLCLNCHNVIRYGTNTGEGEIDKIHQAVDSGKSIQWVKVYNLPDHVFFSHAQHVKDGKINCDKCHGDVANMGRIQQVTDLSMGWCMNCHKETEVQFDNKYYTNYKLQEDLKSGKISKVTVEDIGGNNCQKCHY